MPQEDAVIVNHVGFISNGAKYFVIEQPPEEAFRIIRRWDQAVVYEGRLKRVDQDLGPAWVGCFSEVRQDGTYLIQCGDVTSRVVCVFDRVYDMALRTLFNYFPAQRCGDSDTGWHSPCHTMDAQLIDGGDPRCIDSGVHVDVSGGWHQSCDLRKWTWGTSYGLLGLARLGQYEPLQRWDRGQIAEEIRWGNQYFHKMVRKDGGLMDHVVLPNGWTQERYVYGNNAASQAAYTTIAGQAMAAGYFRERDPDYAGKCLSVGKKMWDYITGDDYPSTPYSPRVIPRHHEKVFEFSFRNSYPGSALDLSHRLFAGIALFEVTGDGAYLDDAYACATALVDLQVTGDVSKNPTAGCFRAGPDGSGLAADTYDGVLGLLGMCSLVQLRPEHKDAGRWKDAVCLRAEQRCQMAQRNPWGLTPSYWYAEDPGGGRPAGSGFYRYFSREFAMVIGNNFEVLGNALFLLRARQICGDKRCFSVACRQLDWVLGCNPCNASTVEGVGRNQPERYINDDAFVPPTPQIPGAVMTGITGTEDDRPAPFGTLCDVEYDMPPTALLMWLLTELAG